MIYEFFCLLLLFFSRFAHFTKQHVHSNINYLPTSITVTQIALKVKLPPTLNTPLARNLSLNHQCSKVSYLLRGKPVSITIYTQTPDKNSQALNSDVAKFPNKISCVGIP